MVEYEPKKLFILKCNHIGEAKLFCFIVTHMNKETRQWFASDANKQRAVEALQSSIPTINRYLSSLKESGLLKQQVRGVYEVNDDYIDFAAEDEKSKFKNKK